jgi:hypothetical protein
LLCPFKCNARLREEIEPQGAKWHKPNFCTERRLNGFKAHVGDTRALSPREAVAKHKTKAINSPTQKRRGGIALEM